MTGLVCGMSKWTSVILTGVLTLVEKASGVKSEV
jgi:hypothetical protein